MGRACAREREMKPECANIASNTQD